MHKNIRLINEYSTERKAYRVPDSPSLGWGRLFDSVDSISEGVNVMGSVVFEFMTFLSFRNVYISHIITSQVKHSRESVV